VKAHYDLMISPIMGW